MTTSVLNLRKESLSAWIFPGIVSGMAFAMWAMVVGLFTSTFWAAPQGIAQFVGIGLAGHAFQTIPFIVGIMAHMMMSIVLAALFVAIVRGFHISGKSSLVLSGMIYGIAVYVVMFRVVLRGLLSSMSSSFLTANPEWSWIIAHAMFGMILGAIIAVYYEQHRTHS